MTTNIRKVILFFVSNYVLVMISKKNDFQTITKDKYHIVKTLPIYFRIFYFCKFDFNNTFDGNNIFS